MEVKRSICEGCRFWVTRIIIRHETGEVDIKERYCSSEEELCAGCAPQYPKLSNEEGLEKIKEVNEYWRNKK